ncbi:MAG: insulinase family protein [Treponema sp.]|nr:insulinase family protein [Treponema sp.]
MERYIGIHSKTKPSLFSGRGRLVPIIGLLLFLAGVLSCASAAKVYNGLGKPSDPAPFMAAARRGTLPNGLRYYILENTRPGNRAYLTLAVNAGSVLEKDDEQGLAHFVEHMAFNGTARFPESELIDYLRSLGMRFGPEVNAYTSFDETVYGIEVPAETGEDGVKRIPDKALAVIDDWTHAITFAPKDVDDERLVIMEEYRTTLGAGDRLQEQLLPLIFEGSPYAHRRPIGLPAIIEGAPAARLENFYKTWYRTDNMALIFVGDFDGAALEASLGAHFTAPVPASPLNRPRYDLPAPKKGNFKAVCFTDPELPYTKIDLYYKRPPQARGTDLASYRRDMVDNLIDQMLSLRFDEAASKPETPYVWAAGGGIRFAASSRYYILTAQAKTGTAEAALRALLREKETIRRYGFTEPEIDRAKRSLLSDITQMAAEKDRQESGSYVREFTDHFLGGGNVPDIEWELEAVTKLLPGISAKDIGAGIKDYFTAGDLTVLVMAPESEKANLPSQDRIGELVRESLKASVPPPEAAVVSDELIGREPAPGAIAAESRDETGALVWELANGARVILKETANKNNEVILYALARGGTTSADDEAAVSAGLAAEMLGVSGAGPYSRPELIKKLADKQVSLSFWTSNYIRGFQGSAAAGDIKTLFELLHLSFTQPQLDSGAVDALLDQYRTTLAQQEEDPNTAFIREVTKTAYGNHPRFKPLETADLAGVSPDAALDFIEKAMNPADYTFVFTGNLDTAAVRGYTETYLASIPRGETWNTWTDPHIRRPVNVEKAVFKGKEEKSLVFLGWYAPAPYSETAGAAASALSEYLDIILTEDIRESLGGAYSVSVNASLSPFPSGELALGVYFACDPRRVKELAAAVTARIQQTAAALDAGSFAKAVEALKKDYEASMQSNLYIARNYAQSLVLLDLPLARLDKRRELYEAVTGADIQGLTRRLLQNAPAQVILYPEGWNAID